MSPPFVPTTVASHCRRDRDVPGDPSQGALRALEWSTTRAASSCGSDDALANAETLRSRPRHAITHPRADAVGDLVEQRLTHVGIEPPVQRGRAEEIDEALPVEPLHQRVPPHDRRTEQGAGIIDQPPSLVGRAHLVSSGGSPQSVLPKQ